MLGEHAYHGDRRASTAHVWEGAGLAILLALLLAISTASLMASRFWETDARVRAPWCRLGEVPRFQFGFAALAQAIGSEMGAPTDCEHGENSSGNTLQATTTGVAIYYWCTNTPTFTRGQEHWMLTPAGVEHWTGEVDPPRPQPVVRAPDLRHLCQT